MKRYFTRKFIHIPTFLWFYIKIAGVLGAETIPIPTDYLKVIRRNELFSGHSNFETEGLALLVLNIEKIKMIHVKEETDLIKRQKNKNKNKLK